MPLALKLNLLWERIHMIDHAIDVMPFGKYADQSLDQILSNTCSGW
jgi:hypothetical protein